MAGGLSKARFEAIYRSGKRVRGTSLSLLGGPGSGHVGIATSRKIGCHARRNLAKRRVREAMRGAGPLPDGADVIVVAGTGCERAPFQELVSELKDLMRKLRERWGED